ncbi:hypothetical protein PUN4_520097 [Paraburkholderia unamae]|nr:hypothetical protein PUN4_520097 [Paraburkholderia unamae]
MPRSGCPSSRVLYSSSLPCFFARALSGRFTPGVIGVANVKLRRSKKSLLSRLAVEIPSQIELRHNRSNASMFALLII